MKYFTNDDKWEDYDTDVMTLTLEHHMAARRMGFSTFFDPLYAVDKIKTSLLDGTSTSINLFSKIVLVLYQAYINNNKFEVANVIKKHSELVNKQTLLKETNKLSAFHSTNEKVNELMSLWGDGNQPTLLEILKKINETKLFKIPSTLKLVLARTGAEVTENEEEEEIEEEESRTHADEDDSPSMSVVDAACGGDLRPGCITDILGTFCEYEEECQCFRRRRSCIDKSTQNATSPSSKWRRRSGWIQ